MRCSNFKDKQMEPEMTQHEKDLEAMMEKATAAVLAGDKKEAAFLFRIHEKMKAMTTPIKNTTIPTISITSKPTSSTKDKHLRLSLLISRTKTL